MYTSLFSYLRRYLQEYFLGLEPREESNPGRGDVEHHVGGRAPVVSLQGEVSRISREVGEAFFLRVFVCSPAPTREDNAEMARARRTHKQKRRKVAKGRSVCCTYAAVEIDERKREDRVTAEVSVIRAKTMETSVPVHAKRYAHRLLVGS